MVKGRKSFFGSASWILSWILGVILYLFAIEVLNWNWYKLTSIVLFTSFFVLWFRDFDNWPFRKLRRIWKGVGIVIISFVLAMIMWKYIGMTDWDPFVKGIPMASTALFLYFVVSWSFENTHLDIQSYPKKAFIQAIIYLFLAYILIKAGEVTSTPLVEGLPFYWFPLAIFYFYGFDSWVTEEMKQPTKGIVDILTVLFLGTIFVLIIIHGFGVEPLVTHLNPELLAWTAVYSSVAVPLFILVRKRLWDRLKQPVAGVVGLAVLGLLSTAEFRVLSYIVGLDNTIITALGFSVTFTAIILAFAFDYIR